MEHLTIRELLVLLIQVNDALEPLIEGNSVESAELEDITAPLRELEGRLRDELSSGDRNEQSLRNRKQIF